MESCAGNRSECASFLKYCDNNDRIDTKQPPFRIFLRNVLNNAEMQVLVAVISESAIE